MLNSFQHLKNFVLRKKIIIGFKENLENERGPETSSGRHISKLVAFTLAETLITLVIIGVVAALTVPNLIIKHQKEETVTRLKKTYSTFLQIYNLARIDNGPVESWDLSTTKKYFETYIKPYIKTTNDCSAVNCATAKKYNFAGLDYSKSFSDVYNFITIDGQYVHLIKSPGLSLIAYVVDINGDKKPNIIGKDIFIMAISGVEFKQYYINGKAGFYLWGAGNNRNALLTGTDGCKKTSRDVFLRGTCGALIQHDGWQIKDDYPW